jgi:hypothetical protein
MNEALIVDRMPVKGSSCSELGAVVTDISNCVAATADGVECTANRSVRSGVINGIEKIESHLRRTLSNIHRPDRSSMEESLRDAQRDAIWQDSYPLLPNPVIMRYDFELNALTLARDSELAPFTNSDRQLLSATERLVKKAMLLDLETRGMRLGATEELNLSNLLVSSMDSVRLNGQRLARGVERKRKMWGRRR